MKEKMRIGIVGLGQRGFAMLDMYSGLIHLLKDMDDVEIISVCDEKEDRVKRVVEFLKKDKGIDVKGTTDYKELVNDPDIDAVGVFCSWEMHVPIAVAAMRAGKAVALEVGGAYSVEDCYRLVRTQEETGAYFMLIENCCYGRPELMALNMARKGLFGELVHCAGSYSHDLRDEVSMGEELGHYRLRNYLGRNCDNYPTHELGPIAKILDINRGNRMVSLASFASKSAGLNEYNKQVSGENSPLAKAKFAQGDIITTIIRCAKGETIVLTLDTTLPRPYYTRSFTVRGTKGFLAEESNSVLIDEKLEKREKVGEGHPIIRDNLEDFYEEYDNPIWKEYYENGIEAGHGGIDYHVLRAFVESWKNDLPAPIDVYDAAAWMSISALSEISITKGGALVEIPDFTGGRWIKVPEAVEWKYSL